MGRQEAADVVRRLDVVAAVGLPHVQQPVKGQSTSPRTSSIPVFRIHTFFNPASEDRAAQCFRGLMRIFTTSA